MAITPAQSARSLRNLYLVRTGFQVIWTAGIALTAITRPVTAAVLLILYPLWDVACTLYDLKNSGQMGAARRSQTINAVLGVVTAIAIALTVFSQPAYAIAAFGAWALAAGLLQLIVGLFRRKQLGGQWAMILSGAQSSAAGIFFVLGGLAGKLHVKDLGGYATFGAIYFLIGGILLARRASRAS
ncbi:MAG TPA: hypothetical protein VIM62_06070 [Acidobacteriaceae bacterium]